MSHDLRNSLNMPWMEKYRPQSLSEVASQSITIQSLQEFVAKKTIPHLIFTGPAGTGKTSAARSLINDLIGTKNITQDMILERNASDSVRMDTRDEIKNFVNHSSFTNSNGFKFIILDESDNISNEMQGAFRRIIEMAPPNVKFIFMCNYVEKIIDPILSRCAIFRFYPLPKREFNQQITKIAKNENITVTSEVLDAIYYISQGDMRQAINLFQMSVALLQEKNGKIDTSKLDPDNIYKISGFLPFTQIQEIYSLCTQNEFLKVVELIRTIKGYSSRGLFRQLMTTILMQTPNYPILEQLLILIAEYDYRLSLEVEPQIQIEGFFAEIIPKIILTESN